jgi:hypothetical protein
MKGACTLVTIMARWLGRDLDYLADHLAPTLYKLTPITVQVHIPLPPTGLVVPPPGKRVLPHWCQHPTLSFSSGKRRVALLALRWVYRHQGLPS